MKPVQITGYMLEDKYLISGGKTYRLEKLTDDESIAETYNGGDALPIIQGVLAGKATFLKEKEP
jgi:hypothetical protein